MPFSNSLDRLRRLGVWADRWTSPDLLAQLHMCLKRPIDTVICNLLDVDPAVPLQARIAGEWPKEVVHGVAAFASLTGAGRAWIAVPFNLDPAVWSRLTAAVRATDVRLVPLRNDYPQASPVLLMRELSDRRLRPGQLPPEHGVLLFDAAAAAAAGRGFLDDEPMLTVPIAVHDHIVSTTHYLNAAIGAAVSDVFKAVGMSADSVQLFAGTPLRQETLSGNSVIGGGELTFYTAPRASDVNPAPCIRCAWCVEACPVRIQPAGLLEAAQQHDLQLADEYGLPACIECGICSYVCPSHLPLLGAIRLLRTF